MRTAIYPGSFDPITYGHLDILKKAAHLFDKIIITVALNPSKSAFFSPEERVSLIQKVLKITKHDAQLSVATFKGLIVDFANQQNAKAIIRGLRAISDFEYEFQMALVNRRLSSNISTVFLVPHEKYVYLNSSIVKEIASFGGDISNFVSPVVEEAINQKLSRQSPS